MNIIFILNIIFLEEWTVRYEKVMIKSGDITLCQNFDWEDDDH